MKSNSPKVVAMGVLLSVIVSVPACRAPRSVDPLLAVTDRILDETARQLAVDAQLDQQRHEQTLRSLDHAYRRDLEQRDDLTAQWVWQATAALTAARDAVQQQRYDDMGMRARQQANIEMARHAVGRARSLLGLQDQFVEQIRSLGSSALNQPANSQPAPFPISINE